MTMTHEEDDFFGAQYDNDKDDNNEMTHRHQVAMEHQFENIGFLEAFERTQEDRLQEGFDAGYRDCAAVAKRVGICWGKICAKNAVADIQARARVGLVKSLDDDDDGATMLDSDVESSKVKQGDVALKLRDFLANELQGCDSFGVDKLRNEDMKRIEEVVCGRDL